MDRTIRHFMFSRLAINRAARSQLGELLMRGPRSDQTDRHQLRPWLEKIGTDWASLEASARRDAALLRGMAGWLLAIGDADYPPQLGSIDDPPPVLMGIGSMSALLDTQIAMVGGRRASRVGRDIAARIASDLVKHQCVVTSGMALGIDASAHRGALAGGGTTIAVLGTGLDVLYPPQNADLPAQVLEHGGAIVTEMPLGTRALPQHFPLRNRIISGLSRAVVILEAGERSGSLVTARLAMEQGRDVMVVPSAPLDGRNRGGHRLIREGAQLVESAEQVLAEIGIPVMTSDASSRVPDDPVQRALLDHLSGEEPMTVDDLVELTARPSQWLQTQLLQLELGGFVRVVAHGYIRSP